MNTSSSPELLRVLVIGGYGFFGRRLVERLALQSGLHLIVAGRSAARAAALAGELAPRAASRLEGLALDALADDLPARLGRLGVHVVVHTRGPFQGQDYRVALACSAAGVHYLDLADGSAFVAGIAALDAAAAAAGICVLSGASSVPALSAAAVDALVGGWQRVDAIDIGISPGNRTERGLSTIQAVLSYCGRPVRQSDGSTRTGWLASWARRYPAPVGWRLLSRCDVPDLVLLPLHWAGRPAVRFGAGAELMWQQLGMNTLALLVRMGVVRDPVAHAGWLKRACDRFQTWGSDAGAMHVEVRGLDAQGHAAARTWTLLATHGDGPYVPTLAAAALVRRLAAGAPLPRGARPCIGVLTLEDFARETAGLGIAWRIG